MNGSSAVNNWIKLAKNDLRVAEFLFQMQPPDFCAMAFHCQQSIEKILKASLVANKVLPPKTHDLVFLIRTCRENKILLPKDIEAVISLTPFAVAYRYPDAGMDELEATPADLLFKMTARNFNELLKSLGDH